jgi:hypothetical protein
LKQACILIAVALLSGRDPEQEYMTLAHTSETFGKMSLTREAHDLPPHLLAGIPSLEAWRLIVPYVKIDQTITLSRGD